MKKTIVLILSTLIIFMFIFSYKCIIPLYTFASKSPHTLHNYSIFCTKALPITKVINNIKDGKYIIILQNSDEIRSSGGFLGSYAVVEVNNLQILDWKIKDIYTADGQILGHVDNIIPLQQSFRNGTWRIQDSNWHIDYEQAAKDMYWFFDKAGETNIQAIFAINLNLIEQILNLTGPIKPIDYQESVTSENFSDIAQSYSQTDFFPGYQGKKNYLSSFGKTLYFELIDLNPINKIKLFNLIRDNLTNGEVLLWAKNDSLQDILKQNNLTGNLSSYSSDYFYMVESNLGSNKANCCIERSISHLVDFENDLAISNYEIVFNNANTKNTTSSPYSWGGDYINYLRLVIPNNATKIKVSVDDVQYFLNENPDPINPPNLFEDHSFYDESYHDYKIIGFWVITKSQNKSKITFSYNIDSVDNYSLVVQKQPGINPYIFNHNLNDKIESKLIKTKTTIIY